MRHLYGWIFVVVQLIVWLPLMGVVIALNCKVGNYGIAGFLVGQNLGILALTANLLRMITTPVQS